MSKNKNHYEVLNLKQDCTTQEIKAAFIDLSKKFHPDKSGDKSHHANFIKINEAYSVLGKPSSRRIYDYDLHANKERVYHHQYDNVYSTKPIDPTYRGRGFGDGTYYSIRGLKKVSNSAIVGACLVFVTIGLGVEYFAINKSLADSKEKLLHDSARNHMLWEMARKEAERHGNDEQLKRFQHGLLKGTNVQEANDLYARQLFKESSHVPSE